MGKRGEIIQRQFYKKAQSRGTTVTFKSNATSAYDATTGAATTSSAPYVRKGFFEAQREMSIGNFAGDASTVRGKGKVLYLPAYNLSPLPQAGDVVTIASKHYQLRESMPMTADDTTVCYQLTLEDA